MRATLSVTALRKALAIAVRSIDRCSTIPILEYAKLSVADGALTIAGTNLDIWTSVRVPLASAEDGEICVSRRLFNLVATLPAFDAITLRRADDDRLTIETPDGRASLITLPAKDHPQMNDLRAFASFDIEAATLRDIFTRIGRFSSTEKTLYYLNGIFMKSTGGRNIAFAATNGHMLGETAFAFGSDVASFDAIIPTGTVSFMKWLRPVAETAKVELLLASTDRPSYARFALGDVEIVSRLIDGPFPDYKRVIPANHKSVWAFDCSSWINGITRMLALRARDQGAVRIASDKSWRISITTHSPDFGDCVAAIKGRHDFGEGALDFFCNGHMLKEVLQAHRATDIRLNYNDNASPLVFESEKFRSVLMPMRESFNAMPLPDGASA